MSAGYLGAMGGNTFTGAGTNYVEVGGTLSGTAVWANQANPYVIDPYQNMSITPSGKLTIAPGVVVKFRLRPSSAVGSIWVYGTLLADGSAAQPVYFTSLADDTVGGDTNGDGATTAPAAGDWAAIRFEADAKGSLSYAVFRYGGASRAALDIATGLGLQPALGAGLQFADCVTGLIVSGATTNAKLTGALFSRDGTGGERGIGSGDYQWQLLCRQWGGHRSERGERRGDHEQHHFDGGGRKRHPHGRQLRRHHQRQHGERGRAERVRDPEWDLYHGERGLDADGIALCGRRSQPRQHGQPDHRAGRGGEVPRQHRESVDIGDADGQWHDGATDLLHIVPRPMPRAATAMATGRRRRQARATGTASASATARRVRSRTR